MLNMSLANMVNKHDEAKKFAEKILESVNITGYKAAACLELGHAQRLQGTFQYFDFCNFSILANFSKI